MRLKQMIVGLETRVQWALIKEILNEIQPIADEYGVDPVFLLSSWIRLRITEENDEIAKSRLGL